MPTPNITPFQTTPNHETRIMRELIATVFISYYSIFDPLISISEITYNLAMLLPYFVGLVL